MPNEPTVSLDAAMIESRDRSQRCRCATSRKHYDAIAALTDVSFDVLPGRGARAARRERRRQVDADERRLGRHDARQRHDRLRRRRPVEHLTPAIAQDLGIAIVHQHPALLPDMTVAENILVARRARASAAARSRTSAKAMRALLDDVHFAGPPRGPRLVAQRRPAPPARARQGVRRLAAAADPRRADRAALAGLRRAPLQRRPQARRGGHGRRLHHAPAGRGARDRRPRHGPARRQAARDVRRRRASRTRTCSRMIIGRTLEATFPPKHAPAAGEAPLLRVEGLSGDGFDEHLVQRPAGRDRRHRRRRRQRPAGAPARPRRASSRRPARSRVGGKELSRRRAARRAPPTCRPTASTEGLMIEPERARERRADRARLAQVGALRQPPPRDRGGRARALRAGRQGAVARGAGLGALGRQPAEGRDGARDALRAGHPASPTSRRRASTSARAPRSTASCARSTRRRRAGRARLERRAGARRACATA